MCGIVGIIGWNKNQFFKPQQQAFKNLVYLDAFRGEDTKHIGVIGPDAFAAQLEGSKAFAKSFMKK